jgi:hypothetical protein
MEDGRDAGRVVTVGPAAPGAEDQPGVAAIAASADCPRAAACSRGILLSVRQRSARSGPSWQGRYANRAGSRGAGPA